MKENSFVLKGDICYSENKDSLVLCPDSYAVCENGISRGVFKTLPDSYAGLDCYDYTGQLIIPGLVDMHVHAPQYMFRGIDMDLELIDWLNTHTFPEEAKYSDLSYADKAYDIFADDLKNSATTRACVFGTMHTEATLLLMEKLEASGISAFVGKVNMDRNSPLNLCEKSAVQARETTQQWLEKSAAFRFVKPILTPRFIPTCSDDMMAMLSELQKTYRLPVQSHLSENTGEIGWVSELCPDTAFYGEAYAKYGLFGGDCPTIMAHCVHSGTSETELMRKNGVFIAHCPESNANLSSGIAPVRAYLEQGLKVGLGSDVAAGTTLSMFHAMAEAVRCSKLRWRLTDSDLAPLKAEEVFYMTTKGGGEFFGKVGSFENDYAFDAVILNDSLVRTVRPLSLRERLERMIYLAHDGLMTAKYIGGRKIEIQPAP